MLIRERLAAVFKGTKRLARGSQELFFFLLATVWKAYGDNHVVVHSGSRMK